MAASCLGVLGAFQYSIPRCTAADDDPNQRDLDAGDDQIQFTDNKSRCIAKTTDDELVDMCPKCNDEIVWVIKRYQPTDPRFTVPVPRFKIVARDPATICKRQLERYDAAGQICCRPTARSYTRPDVEKQLFVSQHHTRSEQWSTLREMLPLRARPIPVSSPNWGTGGGVPTSMVGTRVSRFPAIESEMTRFVSAAGRIDPMFSLF
jgi:hypothetical protein